MRYIVCTPDQKLAVFDEDGGIVEFEAWDFDPETDLDKMYDRLFSNVGRRLFEAELSYAKRELSPLADWQIEANEFSTRWERAVSKLVLYHDTEHALQILSEMGFPNYVLPLRLLEARAAQDRVEEASPRWEKAYPEWKSPIVDSTKDEGVWSQI